MKSYKTYIEKVESTLLHGVYLFKNNGYLLAGLFIDLKSKSKSYVKYPYNTFQKMVGVSKYVFKQLLERHREYK